MYSCGTAIAYRDRYVQAVPHIIQFYVGSTKRNRHKDLIRSRQSTRMRPVLQSL